MQLISFSSIYPPLTIRFVVSLRKSADPDGGKTWQLEHFTTTDGSSDPPPDAQDSVACENIQTADDARGWIHTHESQGSTMEVGLRDV